MEAAKDPGLIGVLIPLLIIVFIIAVGVVMLYQHFQKNLYVRKLKEETLRRDHQRELLRTNTETQEEERKRIAHDLHDELGAVLSIMRMKIMMLEQQSTGASADLLPGLQNVRSLSESALANMRGISHRLMPPQLEKFGLIKTLQSVTTEINTAGKLQIALSTEQAPAEMPWPVSLGMYRAIMELVNNTIKHSGATEAAIDITEQDRVVVCRYTDNGTGIVAENAGTGLGHKSIYGRISALDGTFIFGSHPGEGFYASIYVPLIATG